MKTSLFIAYLATMLACSSSRDEINADNIKKVKIGMKISDVKKIMGVPESITVDFFNDQEFEFRYSSSSKYEDDFRIYCSRNDSTVIRIAIW